jgi:hypothetical protein
MEFERKLPYSKSNATEFYSSASFIQSIFLQVIIYDKF